MTKIKANRNLYTIIGIILFFLVVSLIYFSPVLEGKKLNASDVNHYEGMAKEIKDYREATGEEALWTNSQFSGMPAYLISIKFPGELFSSVQKIINKIIPQPANYIFLNFIFFFVLCLILGLNPFVSMLGALMYGFASHYFVLISAGHITKVHTLNYMALVIAGILYAYNKKPLLGSLIAAIGLSWMLSANHPQMTYYVGIMSFIIGVVYLIYAIKDKLLPKFIKTSVFLVIGMLLALGTNFARLYTTYEYGKYSIRGQSELTLNNENELKGLDKDYILEYSYDLGEVFSAFIPRFKGGGMNEPLGEDSEVYKLFEETQGPAAARQVVEALPLYWGNQPISSAPFYFGAVLCFLFVFGLFVVKGRDKWWIAAVVLISFLLSLGNDFSALSNLMIDYFPGYNKFRDVKNIIVVQQFAMALLGVLAIREIYQGGIDKTELFKKLKYAWFIVGGFALIFVVFPGMAGNFVGSTDAQLAASGWPNELLNALQADRKMVLRNDAIRSFVFVTLSAGLIYLYVQQKLKATYALLLWGVLILVDMWPINKKYLNDDNFQSQRKAETPYTASAADLAILEDTDPDYRVLNLTVSIFQDASTSYFHKSLGGYHGAKLERYQELYQYQLAPELSELANNFTSFEAADSALQTLPVLNMLNTRYIIYNPEVAPLKNSHALGNAWFVNEVEEVHDSDEEILALSDLDPSEKAIVDQRYSNVLEKLTSGSATGSTIGLIQYDPNSLKYKAYVEDGTKLAVFSEIYYPKGWNAYIDGQKAEYVRANYVLRALPVPQGDHNIEFRFEPNSYYMGNNISLASSLLLFLALGAVVFVEYKNRKVNSIIDEGEV